MSHGSVPSLHRWEGFHGGVIGLKLGHCLHSLYIWQPRWEQINNLYFIRNPENWLTAKIALSDTGISTLHWQTKSRSVNLQTGQLVDWKVGRHTADFQKSLIYSDYKNVQIICTCR